MSAYTPSTYQLAVYTWISEGRGNLFIEATAGSGKTSTLVHAATLIAGRGLCVSFNKSIALELERRLAGSNMESGTIHSKGFACLKQALNLRGKFIINGRKYTTAFNNAVKLAGVKRPGDSTKLVDLVRVNLAHDTTDGRVTVTAKHIEGIVQHHGLDLNDEISLAEYAKILTNVYNDGLAQIKSKSVDFTDMIWAPIVLDLKGSTYGWVFVDEAQDLSRCQLAMVTKFSGAGGRMIFVGDPGQAIYGFAGADSKSVSRIVDIMKCEVLPLSVSYRCPLSHVELAQRFCPTMQAREGAPKGLVQDVDASEIPGMAKEGDMFLCRVNAPLIRLCFKLIAQGLPARVRGGELDKDLLTLVSKLSGVTNKDFDRFGEALQTMEDEHIDRLQKIKARPTTIDAVADKFKCLRIIYVSSGATTFPEMKYAIKDIFDDRKSSLVLSSVHKAKGLEADRVFILCPEKMPHPLATSEWEQEQEANIQYVAFTRSKSELYFIQGEIDEALTI